MPFSYANPTSGPSAGGIGWFDFGNLIMNPGDSVTGLTGTLNDGNIVTFDMSLSLLSGTPRQFNATPVPTYPLAQFGAAGYTGISGNVAMYAGLNDRTLANSLFTISNITVKTPGGDPVPNYSVLVADAESTNLFEGISGQTNGGNWSLFTTVGAGSVPTLTGIGTQNFNFTGVQQFGPVVAYVLNTQAPTQLQLTMIQQDPAQTRQGFAIGFATTRVTLQKNIGQRIDPSDQFTLNITGTPFSQATTVGASNGIQSELAQVYATPGNTYNLNEAMAPGSVSAITDYTRILSSMNATPAGTVPPSGSLPINFTPALGDDVTFTILNAAPDVFTKTVDKAYADTGDILTYTVMVDNPNDFAVSNVLVVDPLPQGVTYLGGLTVSVPYTGSDPASGITLITIPADSVATLSWQVRVNTQPPVSNPIVNLANITVPGGNSGTTNPAVTQINHAYVSITKSVDKLFAQPGDTLTYTLLLTNFGNAPASSISIADVIPAGTVYIPGSVTADVPFTGTPGGTLLLSTPLASGASATVSFKVTVNGIPAVNPIPNSAAVSYAYTVDPTVPVIVTATNKSNTVNTLISIASLQIAKAVDKSVSYIGDTITYNLTVQAAGNVPADQVVITDPIPNGTVLVPGSLVVSVPYTGLPGGAIKLTNPVQPGQTVTISFKVLVTAMPNPNPIINKANVAYAYTLNPNTPDGVTGTAASNPVTTLVFRNNYGQQITDLITSVALEQAALAAVANAEGAKIQAAAAMGDITQQELLCINKSVADMTDSISMLEAVLKQKLNIVGCQIDGTGVGCM